MPRGLLREPVSSLARAQVVALTRASLADLTQRIEIKQRVAKLSPESTWVELNHAPTALVAGKIREPVESLRGQRVLAFCGLGNPDGFRHTLTQSGTELVDFVVFADHHEYSKQDIERLRQLVTQTKPSMVVCTHKDWVKIELDQMAGVPLRALLVEQEIFAGEELLHRHLDGIIAAIRVGEDEAEGL